MNIIHPRPRDAATLAILLSLAMATAGCVSGGGDGGGGGGRYCARVVGHFERCGLLTEGDFGCAEPKNSVEQCEADCILSLSCETLVADLCLDDPAAEAEAEACEDTCDPRFTCDEGKEITSGWVCDGEYDCADLTDEEDCEGSPGFVCDDGERIYTGARCNGSPECADASDEEGCPRFSCDDGTELAAALRCDGRGDCEDGSDELGCAERVCP